MVLDELDMSAVAESTNASIIRETIAILFWRWYEINKEFKLVTIRKWFFNHTFTVKELYGVFVLLFGPQPTS